MRGYSSRLADYSIIPPGIALIIYGLIADVSIGKMFMAGIVPGILGRSF